MSEDRAPGSRSANSPGRDGSWLPNHINWSGSGELVTTHTPRRWRIPRVGQIFMEDTTLIRRKAKEFDDEIEASIARNIRTMRIRAGYRQIDLAVATGSDRHAVSRIERCAQPVRAGQLMRIAIQLREPIGMFFVPARSQIETGWEPRRAEPHTPYWVDLLFERDEFPDEHPFYDRW